MRNRRVSSRLSGLLAVGLLSAVAARAGAGPVNLPYFEDFQNPAPSSNPAADYPEFDVALNGGTANVDAAGVLHLFSDGNNTDQTFTVTPNSPSGELVIRAQVGASDSNGNYNVGLVLGQNALAFHPGFGGPPAGAFRIDGPGGFGNSDMGFVPANGVLHQVEVHSFPNGDFNITVTDGSNPGNVYSTSFNNPASYGGPIGLRRSGPTAGDGQFDNFSIAPIPEPAALGLLSLGAVGLLARRRRAADGR